MAALKSSNVPPKARPAENKPLPTREPPAPSVAPSGDLVTRIKQKRPLIGGYLEGARMEREGNRITFTFDDAFHADSVSDAKDAIAQIASELLGEKMTVETKVASADANGGRSDDKPAPLRDDPVDQRIPQTPRRRVVKEKRMNIKQLMKQAQQMQDQMQRQMASINVEGSAGGGMVKATMSGNKELLSITIDKQAIDPKTSRCSRTSSRRPSTKPRARSTKRCSHRSAR